VMRVALPTLAVLLMQTTLELNADPDLGPTAGPGFNYRPVPMPDLIAEVEDLLAHPLDRGSDYQQLWQKNLGIVRKILGEAMEATGPGPGGAAVARSL
jgi:hypothetical protein